jgi:hypothetical protein
MFSAHLPLSLCRAYGVACIALAAHERLRIASRTVWRRELAGPRERQLGHHLTVSGHELATLLVRLGLPLPDPRNDIGREEDIPSIMRGYKPHPDADLLLQHALKVLHYVRLARRQPRLRAARARL